jgi:hypothetical protein
VFLPSTIKPDEKEKNNWTKVSPGAPASSATCYRGRLGGTTGALYTRGLEVASVIKALLHPITGTLNLAASVGGTAVYLDNFAISSLATGDATLRRRFVAAINGGADLMFSIAHAIELPNSVTVKAFLDELGDRWYPIELVIQKVLDREDAGQPADRCCFDEDLLNAYFANSTCGYLPGSQKVIDLSAGRV